MVNYASLLLGGKGKSKGKVMVEEPKMEGGKMTYEQRCKNLEKARATRAANLKKKVSGKGNYNQDYVDESQVNYAGSPLDLYYRNSEAQQTKERQVRGEIKGKGRKKGKGLEKEAESEEEELEGGKTRLFKKKVQVKDMKIPMSGGDMTFMKGAMHAGMDMPSEAQFKRGGEIKKGSKAKKEKEEKSPEEYKVDLDGAIENLGHLASKFGLRLVK